MSALRSPVVPVARANLADRGTGPPGASVATVRGSVTDAAALPVEAASVVVTGAGGEVVAARATAADGTFAVPLPTGTYRLTIAAGTAVVVRDLDIVGAVPPPVIDLAVER